MTVRCRFSDNRDTTTQQFLTDEMPENLHGNLVHYSPFQSDASRNSSPRQSNYSTATRAHIPVSEADLTISVSGTAQGRVTGKVLQATSGTESRCFARGAACCCRHCAGGGGGPCQNTVNIVFSAQLKGGWIFCRNSVEVGGLFAD